MKTKIELLKENATDDMLRIIGFLDIKITEISESNRKNGFEYGSDLSYDILNDSTLQYDFVWSDYEESDNDTVVIKFLKDGNIRISKINDGYSVMMSPGDYTNSELKTVSNISELMNWLTEQFE